MDADMAEYTRAAYGRLLRRGYLLVGDAGLAEDLVQETLLRTLAASRRRPLNDLDAYSSVVLLRLAISQWRRTRRLRELPSLTPDLPGLGEEGSFEDQDAMWQALGELPRQQRAVLVLRYYEDMSESQIAAAMDVGVGTVRRYNARALDRLRAVLESRQMSGDSPS